VVGIDDGDAEGCFVGASEGASVGTWDTLGVAEGLADFEGVIVGLTLPYFEPPHKQQASYTVLRLLEGKF